MLIASVSLFGCGSSEEESGEPGTRVGIATDSQPAAGDRIAPSTPTDLSAAAITPTQIGLTWSASEDNVGVTGYRVYRSGVLLITLGDVITYQDTSVSAGTSYSYTVQALDGIGNASGQSTAAIVTHAGHARHHRPLDANRPHCERRFRFPGRLELVSLNGQLGSNGLPRLPKRCAPDCTGQCHHIPRHAAICWQHLHLHCPSS